MISMLRQIILSATAAALFGTVALALTKNGAVKEVVRMAVGILLILSLTVPLRKGIPSPDLLEFSQNTLGLQTDAEDLYRKNVQKQFEADTAAYIQSILEQQQCIGSVQVTSACDEENTISIEQIDIHIRTGSTKQLRSAVGTSLGIAEERIVVHSGGDS